MNNMQIDWQCVMPMFGIDTHFLTNRHKPCPVCGGKDRFRFDNKGNSGSFFCSHCGAGNGVRLIVLKTGLSAREIFSRIRNQFGHYLPAQKSIQNDFKKPICRNLAQEKQLEHLWQVAKPLNQGDVVTKYLSKRIHDFHHTLLSTYIRIHPAMCYYDNNDVQASQTYPVMLSRVVDVNNQLVNLHRTYLTQGGSKAPVKQVKKLMRGIACLDGAAIRLNDAHQSQVLAVCEGIETGLAVLTALKGKIHVWSAVNCHNLAVLKIPKGRFNKLFY